MSSSRLSSSCPSLPDLAISGTGGGGNNFWPNQMYGLNMDRRKSWTAIEDLTECTKNSNKRCVGRGRWLPVKASHCASSFFGKSFYLSPSSIFPNRSPYDSCPGGSLANAFNSLLIFPHTHCSASLSSVDSEESLRAAERLHNRQSRNSAGGISTHSLNEAELVVSGWL